MNIQIKKKSSRTQCQSHQVDEKDKSKRVLLITPCNTSQPFIKELLDTLAQHGMKVCHSEFEIKEFCIQTLNKFQCLNHQAVDFIIVVGGQDYIKAASFILQREHIPPVISIMENNSMLSSIQMDQWKIQLQAILGSYQKCFMMTEHLFRIKINLENISVNVLSQIVIKRTSIHCVTINIYVNHELFTSTVGDGLVIATPLGSTGYALCCGGAIINYLSKSIMLVGINPLTLSFRPIILLQNQMLEIQIASESRGEAVAQVDGLLSIQWPRGKRYQISSGSQFMMVRQDTTGKCLKKLKEIYNWNGGYSK